MPETKKLLLIVKSSVILTLPVPFARSSKSAFDSVVVIKFVSISIPFKFASLR